jgi:hypothetical protein
MTQRTNATHRGQRRRHNRSQHCSGRQAAAQQTAALLWQAGRSAADWTDKHGLAGQDGQAAHLGRLGEVRPLVRALVAARQPPAVGGHHGRGRRPVGAAAAGRVAHPLALPRQLLRRGRPLRAQLRELPAAHERNTPRSATPPQSQPALLWQAGRSAADWTDRHRQDRAGQAAHLGRLALVRPLVRALVAARQPPAHRVHHGRGRRPVGAAAAGQEAHPLALPRRLGGHRGTSSASSTHGEVVTVP